MMQRSTNGGDASRAGHTIRIAGSMGDFSHAEWENLTGTARDCASGSGYNPFLSFDFLRSLEESGCATPRTGWQASHLRLEDENGALLGAMPAYLKSHSQGEYVFDQGWADAFERAGGDYYPKLQVSIPFTPATGPRLLVRRDLDAAATRATLAAGLRAVTDKLKVSSAHVTFANDEDMQALTGAGYLRRTDQQFPHYTTVIR